MKQADAHKFTSEACITPNVLAYTGYTTLGWKRTLVTPTYTPPSNLLVECLRNGQLRHISQAAGNHFSGEQTCPMGAFVHSIPERPWNQRRWLHMGEETLPHIQCPLPPENPSHEFGVHHELFFLTFSDHILRGSLKHGYFYSARVRMVPDTDNPSPG